MHIQNLPSSSTNASDSNFRFLLEQFSDIKIMRYKVPGFENLSLKQKELVYYLSEAARCGRDMVFDQNYKYNLTIRRTNEAILNSFNGNRETNDFKNFEIYAKRVWFSNGIHHHYSTDKFLPEVSTEYFKELLLNSDMTLLPLRANETLPDFTSRLTPIIFDPTVDAKRIELDGSKDIIKNSAVNFYEDLNENEVSEFNKAFVHLSPDQPVENGLNSRLHKVGGKIVEQTYKIGGLYTECIEQIVYWLEKAKQVAESNHQKESLTLLIKYYQTGDLKIWDDFNVSWVKDSQSHVDFVNGFIETYGDPMGMKATWESIVNFKDVEATKRTEIISSNAQWFEDNAPIDPRFKKQKVKGVSAKVINVAQLGGDCYPTTPIGINLPNADWIRRDHGSKSVTIENITYAHDKAAQGTGFLEEYCYSHMDLNLAKTYGSMASNLHTDLHECLGHGSGQLLPGTSSEALKNYSSALEEARADLFALYYIADRKLIELGLIPTFDVAKAEYNAYLRNGLLTQLTRIKPGKDIEQAHMRNRQLVSKWVLEKGAKDRIIEMPIKDGKTYVLINDYEKLRNLFGELLAEIQRIKSEGDYQAGKILVETYAVKVDQKIHTEVLQRFEKLNIAPYGGFINPEYKLIYEKEKLVDVTIEYVDDYSAQMLKYSKEYSFLPNV